VCTVVYAVLCNNELLMDVMVTVKVFLGVVHTLALTKNTLWAFPCVTVCLSWFPLRWVTIFRCSSHSSMNKEHLMGLSVVVS
jgi:uncharacterized membrane protein